MIRIDANHYTETIIYSIDIIIRNLKQQLGQKIDSLKKGITGEEFVILDTIMCNPNIYQQQLSEMLLLDKSKTARLLKSLEEKNFIKRTIGNSNNRLVYLLNITQDAKKLIREIKPVMKEFLIEVFENINNDEIQLLHGLSRKFQDDLDNVLGKE